jgi:RNA polymerase primary sigma factor
MVVDLERIPESQQSGSALLSDARLAARGIAEAIQQYKGRELEEYILTPLDAGPDTELANQSQDELFDEPTAEDLEDPEIKALESFEIDNNDIYSVDSLTQFLRIAGKNELLTAAQEVSYAKQIELGKEAEAKLKHAEKAVASKMSQEEELRLQSQVKTGQAAKDELVNCNARLVVSVVKRYQGYGVDIADLVQEGNLGLITAAEKFDWRKGFKFSTYATWWVRQAAQRAVANLSRNIRIPVHVNDRIIKLSNGRKRFRAEYGFEPDDAELSEYTSVPIKYIKEVDIALKQQATSLNKLIGDSTDSNELGDLLDASIYSEKNGDSDTAKAAEKSLMKAWLKSLLAELPHDERSVIELRFGLNDDVTRSLKEAGKILGFGREHATDLEKRALQLLANKIDLDGLDVSVNSGESDQPKTLNPADALKQSGLSILGNFNELKSFIGHQLLKGRSGEIIARELGVTYTIYKKIKDEMYGDLGFESEKKHSGLIQELGKLKVAAQTK